MTTSNGTSSSAGTGTYSAAVIGAGPAGLAVVARLLDTNPSHTIAWIDPSFAGGRLQQYPEVPSNTKVKLFLKYAQVSPALCKAADVPIDANGAVKPLAKLEQLDQDAGCELVYAQRMTMHLARNLAVAYPEAVVPVKGWVSKIERSQGKVYSLKVHEGAVDPFSHTPNISANEACRTVSAHHLYVCTGSEPVPVPAPSPAPHDLAPHPISLLDLDMCLTPSRLSAKLSTTPTHVAVIGASHSAILCIMNLVALGHKVTVFSRAPLKYAVYMPEDWILYDNTGLKGQAAAWAKANLEDPAARTKLGIEWVDLPADGVGEDQVYAQHWSDIAHIVYAIGFRTRGLPEMVVDGAAVPAGDLTYDPASGQLLVKSSGKKVPNVRGFGIAFPERITDRMGNVEWSVGMWKFMRYVSEVIQAGELTSSN